MRKCILALLAVLAAALVVFFLFHPCSDIFPCHDSPKTVSIEQHELLLSAKRIYEQYQASPYKPRNDQLPRPLQARVLGGPDASLTVAGPIASNELLYAQVWYDVYHRHHGGTRTVSLHVVWKSGARITTFPVSDL